MRQWNFKITQHKAPERCEVCHQIDMFDKQTNICLRCNSLPLEQLANPVFVIRASRAATILAAILGIICFSIGLIDINAISGQKLQMLMYSPSTIHNKIIILNLVNLVMSFALFGWCKDKHNERLTYTVVIWGRFAAVVGIIGSSIGLLLPLPGILIRL